MNNKLKAIGAFCTLLYGLIQLTEVGRDMVAEKKAIQNQKVVYEKGTTKITEF